VNEAIRERRRARIQHELKGCPLPRPVGPRPGREWVTAYEAREILGRKRIESFAGIQRVKCSSSVNGRPPWLYLRQEIERVAALMQRAGLPATYAIRVVAAENEGLI
jgi:hypothetical protein